MKTIATLSSLLLLAACSGGKGLGGAACKATSDCSAGLFCTKSNVCAAADGSSGGSGSGGPQVTAVSLDATNTNLTVTGTHLSGITALSLAPTAGGGGVTLAIASKSDTSLTATFSDAFSIALNGAYGLVVTTADASTTIAVSFTLPSNVVTTAALQTALQGDQTFGNVTVTGLTVPAATRKKVILPTNFKPTSYGFWGAANGFSTTVTPGNNNDPMTQVEIDVPDGATLTGVQCFEKSPSCTSSFEVHKIVGGATAATAPTLSKCGGSTPVTSATRVAHTVPLTNCGSLTLNSDLSSPQFAAYLIRFVSGAPSSSDGTYAGTENFGCTATYTTPTTLP